MSSYEKWHLKDEEIKKFQEDYKLILKECSKELQRMFMKMDEEKGYDRFTIDYKQFIPQLDYYVKVKGLDFLRELFGIKKEQ
jgi:hypothetical protein